VSQRPKFTTRTILLRTEQQRDIALALLRNVPLDSDSPLRMVVDDPLPAKSREQEKKYHAMIGDIARQFEHCGRKWDADDMKRLLVAQFRSDTIKDVDIGPLWHAMGAIEMAPSLDGSGVVALGIQTRKFPTRLASVFIEWLLAFGAELNIKWSDE